MGWVCWFISMVFFLYIVYELLVGLAAATASEADPVIASKIGTAQVMTVISWCTYPIVYLFPLASQQPRQLCPSSWDIAPLISFPNVGWAWLSTRSLMPNPASNTCCNERVSASACEVERVLLTSFSSLRRHFSFLVSAVQASC